MNRDEILSKVNAVFCDVLDDEDIIITNESCSEDIEEWDSLTNIQLVVAIEKQFGIKFLSSEIMSWDNVGEMVDSILAKI